MIGHRLRYVKDLAQRWFYVCECGAQFETHDSAAIRAHREAA
jgi:hypothetical protein